MKPKYYVVEDGWPEIDTELIRDGMVIAGEIDDSGGYIIRPPGDTVEEQSAWWDQMVEKYKMTA